MTELPQELIDTIIYHIDDTNSLKACSLAATNFVASSQRKIFCSLQLWATERDVRRDDNVDGRPNITAVDTLLTASPHLASYILDLTLDISSVRDEQIIIERLLHLLPNIEHLFIHGCRRYEPWTAMFGGLVTALQAILVRPSLQQLHISYLTGVPPALISLAAFSVPLLSIHSTEILAETFATGFSGISVTPTARLTNFIISEGGDRTVDLWAVLMRFPACLEHLQRLSVVTTAYSTAYDIGLLASVAPILRHFELAAGQTGPYIPLITIPYMPHVKTVELPTVVEDGYTVTYPSRLNSLLAEVAASVPQVEVIILHCVRRMFSEISHVDTTGPLHFPHLRLFHCTLEAPRRNEKLELPRRNEKPMMRRLKIALQELAPAVKAAGIFSWSRADSTSHLINYLP
ncbi:hypothetical protein C8J57DRAFT_1716398 [Mycena rebaudengoi]|nr:hypothetical protein C8J57DRAFT_1716398 [Mycena rebaudengoi]